MTDSNEAASRDLHRNAVLQDVDAKDLLRTELAKNTETMERHIEAMNKLSEELHSYSEELRLERGSR
jgi:hypothetical protein